MTLKQAAACFSVSPATAHRWWHRWLEAGEDARKTLVCLFDRSSRPRRSPRQLAPELAEEVDSPDHPTRQRMSDPVRRRFRQPEVGEVDVLRSVEQSVRRLDVYEDPSQVSRVKLEPTPRMGLTPDTLFAPASEAPIAYMQLSGRIVSRTGFDGDRMSWVTRSLRRV
jgi:hypothetical protein